MYRDNPSWQRVQLARHPKRPQSIDYIQGLFIGFEELHGDRLFGDDKSIIGGIGSFRRQAGDDHRPAKGPRYQSRSCYRNFGMPKPEGYRKAMRLMRLAEKFQRPDHHAHRHARALIRALMPKSADRPKRSPTICERCRVCECPVIAVVIGEGGSGGALAIGVANRVYMLENAYYSVISPESCAAIIYRDSGKAALAAAALKLTAQDLLDLNIIDGIVPESPEGAQNDADAAANSLRETLKTALAELNQETPERLIAERYDKFRRMGNFFHEVAL